jgi:2'-5' RNA ligase
MRTFIGIPLDKETRRAVGQLTGELIRMHVPVSFPPPQNLHITLHFLGEVSPAQATNLGTGLKELSGKHRPFEILFEEIGAFPNIRAARVVWIGIQRGIGQLNALAADVRRICETQSVLGDRKAFKPHLTIGRTVEKFPRPLKLPERYLKYRVGTMTVDRVVLFRSDLSPSGAKYSPLTEIKL